MEDNEPMFGINVLGEMMVSFSYGRIWSVIEPIELALQGRVELLEKLQEWLAIEQPEYDTSRWATTEPPKEARLAGRSSWLT